MGFEIDEAIGPLGYFILALLISAGAIFAIWLFTATREVRREVLDADEDALDGDDQ